MAGFDPTMLTPTLTTSPGPGTPSAYGGGGVSPHHGLIGIVLVALVTIFALDKAGFRFAVSAGKR